MGKYPPTPTWLLFLEKHKEYRMAYPVLFLNTLLRIIESEHAVNLNSNQS